MGKRVAIVGTRVYPHLDRVRSYIATLPPDTTIVSGGALGVDSTAEQAARARGLDVLIFRADWQRDGKGAGLKRNTQIVESADVVVAFWDGESAGTLDSIKKATKRNKKVVIYGVEKEA